MQAERITISTEPTDTITLSGSEHFSITAGTADTGVISTNPEILLATPNWFGIDFSKARTLEDVIFILSNLGLMVNETSSSYEALKPYLKSEPRL